MNLYIFWLCVSLVVVASAVIRLGFAVDKVSVTDGGGFDANHLVYQLLYVGIFVAQICMWELFGSALESWLAASIPQPGTWHHDLLVMALIAVSALAATFVYIVAIAGIGVALKRMNSGLFHLQD